MRSVISIAIVAAACAGVAFARVGVSGVAAPVPASVPQAAAQAPAAEEPPKRIVNTKSDMMRPVAPGDSAIYLVGDFAAQHNGTVITCDSAVRYSDLHLEFFGNVLINKNTTYIYGDRAEYDGSINEARVYSDLVKVVDGDAVFYTYDFRFDTKTNTGEFSGGGVMLNRDNRLEAVRGYYFADTKELVCVDRVEMRNDEYELKGDSVVYNFGSDNAYFFDRTHIWNRDGDYLYADRGEYRKADTLYIVTRNGYILTEKQEVWSDSIDYYRAESRAILRHDLQLDDTEHKTMAFGDYGEYWKEPGDVLLTRRPAVVGYDLSQGPDTLYMRSDTILMLTRFPAREAAERAAADTTARGGAGADVAASEARRADAPAGGAAEMPEVPGKSGTPPVPNRQPGADAPGQPAAGADSLPGPGIVADSLLQGMAADSLAVAIDPLDTLTGDARKAYLKERERAAKEAKKAAAAAAKRELLAKIAAERKAKARAKLDAQAERAAQRDAARRLKAESKLAARRTRAARKGRTLSEDRARAEAADSTVVDSLAALPGRAPADSLAADTAAAAVDSLAADSLPSADTLYRLIKGFRDVRIYRADFQVVCDSMTAISTDSTIHLYIDPVLWNQNNQMTSDVMDIYTRDSRLEHAEFVGSPMMAAQLDSVHYNQIAGKQMAAYFRDNEIYREDVNGNVQTIYYMQDGEPPQITMMSVVESGAASFYIEDRQLVAIVYRTDPVGHIYPMDQIPEDQELYLKGFAWEGARRPAKTDVFDRRIRPSQREERSQLPHPDFPIMRRMEEFKTMLIEARRWTERADRVDPSTVEWMRELGFEVGQPR